MQPTFKKAYTSQIQCETAIAWVLSAGEFTFTILRPPTSFSTVLKLFTDVTIRHGFVNIEKLVL